MLLKTCGMGRCPNTIIYPAPLEPKIDPPSTFLALGLWS